MIESSKQFDPSPYIGWLLLFILILLSTRQCWANRLPNTSDIEHIN